MSEKFQPTLKSVKKHEVPEWFHDAKLDSPTQSSVTIKSLELAKDATINWLGYNEEIKWVQKGEDLTINASKALERSPAYAISITPKPSSH